MVIVQHLQLKLKIYSQNLKVPLTVTPDKTGHINEKYLLSLTTNGKTMHK